VKLVVNAVTTDTKKLKAKNDSCWWSGPSPSGAGVGPRTHLVCCYISRYQGHASKLE
jgi:hypothetical protein